MRTRREVRRVNRTVCVPQVTTDLGLGLGSRGAAARCVVRRSWSTEMRAPVATHPHPHCISDASTCVDLVHQMARNDQGEI